MEDFNMGERRLDDNNEVKEEIKLDNVSVNEWDEAKTLCLCINVVETVGVKAQ
jgi:hypothetical protein